LATLLLTNSPDPLYGEPLAILLLSFVGFVNMLSGPQIIDTDGPPVIDTGWHNNRKPKLRVAKLRLSGLGATITIIIASSS
jgi:hypothetical protein